MNTKYSFGKLNSKIKYLYIEKDKIVIKKGNLAIFGDKFLTSEATFFIKEIDSIEITRPMIKNGMMKIILLSSAIVELDIATIKQYNDANEIKSYIEEYKASKISNTKSDDKDKYDILERLKKLLDNNVITQEEFNSEKKKLLNK